MFLSVKFKVCEKKLNLLIAPYLELVEDCGDF